MSVLEFYSLHETLHVNVWHNSVREIMAIENKSTRSVFMLLYKLA